MAYADRIAVTGDPIPITFAKIIDLPQIGDGAFGTTPFFFSGKNGQFPSYNNIEVSNMPALWLESYDKLGDGVFTGLLAMGVSHGDYAIREAGTGATEDNSEFYDKQGYIDTMFAGFNWNLVADVGLTLDITFQRQVLGGYTGGVAGVIAANAEETQTITFDHTLHTFFPMTWVPGLDSTTGSPAALAVFDVNYTVSTAERQDKVGALRFAPSGAVTIKGLFVTDIAIEPTQGGQRYIQAHCKDSTHHYFLGHAALDQASLTICTEVDWGDALDYANYTPKFDDPDLPVLFSDIISSTSPYQWVATYGTDQGFLISYKKLISAVWQPRFILVDRGWTTVQHIVPTAGDATATTILAQGVGPDNENAINMTMDSGFAWLIGGTPAAPLLVEGATAPTPPPPDGDGDGLTDDSVRLRVWGFSLDDHDRYVLRVGPSESLIYDLTTGQWSEWESPGRTNWRAHIGQNWVGMSSATLNRGFGTDIVAGDDASGTLWVLDPTTGRDDRSTSLSDFFTREVTGGIALDGREVSPCNAVTLNLSLGSPTQTGASITLETSDDLGQTWVNHGTDVVASLDYSAVVEWRSLGQMRAPGRVFRITDNGATVRLGAADLR